MDLTSDFRLKLCKFLNYSSNWKRNSPTAEIRKSYFHSGDMRSTATKRVTVSFDNTTKNALRAFHFHHASPFCMQYIPSN